MTFINYMVRAVRVIKSFCAFLGIRCLAIPHTTSSQKKNILPVTHAEAESLLAGGNASSTYNSIN